MEGDGDVLSETPNGGNKIEDKIGPNFPPSLQHQLLQSGLITGNSVWKWDTKIWKPCANYKRIRVILFMFIARPRFFLTRQ